MDSLVRDADGIAAISRCIPWCGMKPHVLASMQKGRQAEPLIKSQNKLLVLNSEEKTCYKIGSIIAVELQASASPSHTRRSCQLADICLKHE